MIQYYTLCLTSFLTGFIWQLNNTEDVPGLKQLPSAIRVGLASSLLSIFMPTSIPYPLSAAIPVIIVLACFSSEYKAFSRFAAFILVANAILSYMYNGRLAATNC